MTDLPRRKFLSPDLSEFDLDLIGQPFPFFQPIISIEDKKIIGYEVLARGQTSLGKVRSLGPLLQSPSVSEYDKRIIDHTVREEALRKFKASGLSDSSMLFLNIHPHRLLDTIEIEAQDPLFVTGLEAAAKNIENSPTIKMLRHYGISPSHIILEITEHEFYYEPALITHLVKCYRDLGFSIALDDFGSGASNLDRLGEIHPEFIKLDLNLMRKGFSRNTFKEILRSIANLAEKLGSRILVEGIEHENEIIGSLDIGASLLQGFYTGHPLPDFLSGQDIQENVLTLLNHFRNTKLKEMKNLLSFQKALSDHYFSHHLADKFLAFFQSEAPNDRCKTEILSFFSPLWKTHLRSVYLINSLGIQRSPNFNFVQSPDHNFYWNMDERQKGRDLSMKPYFLQFLARIDINDTHWFFSDPFLDIKTAETRVTMVHRFRFYDRTKLLCLDFNISHLHDPLWHNRSQVQ